MPVGKYHSQIKQESHHILLQINVHPSRLLIIKRYTRIDLRALKIFISKPKSEHLDRLTSTEQFYLNQYFLSTLSALFHKNWSQFTAAMRLKASQ